MAAGSTFTFPIAPPAVISPAVSSPPSKAAIRNPVATAIASRPCRPRVSATTLACSTSIPSLRADSDAAAAKQTDSKGVVVIGDGVLKGGDIVVRVGFLIDPLSLLMLAVIIGPNTILASDELASLRRYTRPYEFDFIEWNASALALKWGQAALGTIHYVPTDQRSELVLEYFELVRQVWEREYQVQLLFSDPQVADPDEASAELRQELEALEVQRDQLRPLAEAVLEAQVSRVAAEMGLTLGGQPFPPVLYHTTDPPNGLVVSPREVIRQEYSINIDPQMTLDEIVRLEDEVAAALDGSTLTVGIGGFSIASTNASRSRGSVSVRCS